MQPVVQRHHFLHPGNAANRLGHNVYRGLGQTVSAVNDKKVRGGLEARSVQSLATLQEQQTQQATMDADNGVDLALSMEHDAVVLDDISLPVIQRLSQGLKHSVDSDGDLILGYSTDAPTASVDVSLGQVNCTRWMACARNKLWWMTPEWGTSMDQLPTETQFLLLEHEDHNAYSIMLPLICGDFRATLKADRDRLLQPVSSDAVLRIESGDPNVKLNEWPAVVLVSSGREIYSLIENAVTKAARLSGQAKPRTQKKVPDCVNGFGWCTWDAFYSGVSAEGVNQGLSSLHEGGIRPQTLIIDDGWQMTQVDEDYEEAITTKALRKMKVSSVSMEDLENEFDQAEQTVLSSYADALSGGSELMMTMPALADAEYGDNLRQELRSRDGVTDDSKAEMLEQIETFRKKSKMQIPDIERTIIKLSEQPQEAGLWARLLQRVAGWGLGVAQVLFLFFYQSVVDPAGPFTWPVDLFRKLARGPLKGGMLSFFRASGDFTKRLISVKANGKFSLPNAGPGQRAWFAESQDFRSVISDFRSSFGVRFVYCWHGLPAYWGGVMPSVKEFEDLGGRIVYPEPTEGLREIEPAMLWNPAVLAGIGVVDDAPALYTRMHSYLAASGIDGVKVDCQAGLGLVGSVTGGGPALARRFHGALEDSISSHFPGNHAINCMCHSTENIYQMRDSALMRVSDDFYPREPASTTPHVSACAFNSLFLSVICQPDWDMFQSMHPAAHLHACARAVSGGPVYVSDKVGRHDFAVLRRLVLRDGSVLRAQRPGLPTADCIFRDPMRDSETLLKVWNENQFTGVVGVFHLQGSYWDREARQFTMGRESIEPLWTRVRDTDVPTLPDVAERLAQGGCSATQSTAIHRHLTDEVLIVDQAERSACVRVNPTDADVLTVAPVVRNGQGVQHAVLGLTNMLNCGGAVDDVRYVGETLTVEIRGEGTFLMYCTQKPSHIEVDGVAMPEGDGHEWKYVRQTLRLDVATSALNDGVDHVVQVQF
eukprot:jgi/Ulvmu1/7024/UM033_0083.1